MEELEENYKPLTTWLKETALKDLIDKAVVSNRLTGSPCAIVASQYGWYVGVARSITLNYAILHVLVYLM